MSQRRRNRPPARKKPVQISIDTALVKRIDADAETRAAGRSAFITNAVLRYLRDKENQRIDEQFRTALAGKADELYAEVEPFLAAQVWSEGEALVERRPPPRERKRSAGGRR